MRKFVRVIAVLLILTSVGILGFEYWEFSQFKEQKEELVEISNTFVPPVTNTDPNRDYYAEFNQQFLAINKDYAGWISIADTEIDYPMVRGNNNGYYLTHNFYKERSKYGAIFMDYRNAKDYSDKHVMVYGHAMRNTRRCSDFWISTKSPVICRVRKSLKSERWKESDGMKSSLYMLRMLTFPE
jgi:sortase B